MFDQLKDLATMRCFIPWLRMAGAKVGDWSEVHVIQACIPELIHIEEHCFFAANTHILTGSTSTRQGLVCNTVKFKERSFTGNHAVICGGVTVGSDVLVGVNTAVNHTKQEL